VEQVGNRAIMPAGLCNMNKSGHIVIVVQQDMDLDASFCPAKLDEVVKSHFPDSVHGSTDSPRTEYQ